MKRKGKVNAKSIHMIDSTEKNETEIKKKLAQVLTDRENMMETIETLDQHKRDTVEKVWSKVNGCVFSPPRPSSLVPRYSPLTSVA